MLQKYKEYEKDVTIEEIDGLQLVKKLAKNMEEMFHKKSEAVRVGYGYYSSNYSSTVHHLFMTPTLCV